MLFHAVVSTRFGVREAHRELVEDELVAAHLLDVRGDRAIHEVVHTELLAGLLRALAALLAARSVIVLLVDFGAGIAIDEAHLAGLREAGLDLLGKGVHVDEFFRAVRHFGNGHGGAALSLFDLGAGENRIHDFLAHLVEIGFVEFVIEELHAVRVVVGTLGESFLPAALQREEGRDYGTEGENRLHRYSH